MLKMAINLENARTLILNQEILSKLSELEKPIFILEWLRYLDSSLTSISRLEIKKYQNQIVELLLKIIQNGPGGGPIRNLIAKSMATLFMVGDTIQLFDTVNKCNDLLKSKDDSPSSLAVKLAAVSCLGEMYEKLGRMMGRSYEETVLLLSKSFKNMESQSRIETMIIFEKICSGMENAAASSHKEMYRIARVCLNDRVMPVRTAAAKCIKEMMKSSSFLYTTELESLTSSCFRSLDGADYDSRIAIAELLGTAISYTQNPPTNKSKSSGPNALGNKNIKQISLEESLNILMTGFLRGAASSWSKGEIIKGGSGVNREVRVGVTHAYVAFVEKMGGLWLEKNIEIFTTHIVELVANPKAATSHVDAVYSRKCVNFILRRSFSRLLGEKAQFTALKILSAIIIKQMNSIDFNPENAKENNQETIFNQHLLVCALIEMSTLFLSLRTSISHLVADTGLGMVNGIFSVLIHPLPSTRLAAAWALRSLCVALPSEANKSIERCLIAFDTMKTSPEALSGYSAALAAILGGVREMPLGIPYAAGKIAFNTAEVLLRSANQNSRLSIQRANAGWIIVGAIMTLGNSVVQALLPRMLLLWRNSFPKSTKELESEKARGDAFTWQVTLESRAGALSSIHSFLLHCPEIVTDEIVSRLLVFIESALAMMTNLSSTLKSYGQQLKVSAALLRFRLYETLFLIKPTSFERSYTHMLRFVVPEFLLIDNAANTTTSLFNRICQSNAIFNSLISDHMSIEDQLQPSSNQAAGSGALEHDPCSLYRKLPEGFSLPSSPPLGVAVIDASIELFGILYPHISTKHRNQLIEHFQECLKVTKNARKEAVLINIFCAFLCAMKSIRKLQSSSIETEVAGKKEINRGCEELKIVSQQFVIQNLAHPSNILRCAASELLGRVAQTVSDTKFTSEMAQMCSDKIKTSREAVIRTGHSLALGCLHKYLGGMDSIRHQHGSVSILLNLAQDHTNPELQMWALHSLCHIADTGGPLFRSYVEPSLSLVKKLILTVPLTSVDLRQAIGKIMAALIIGIGPELQIGENVETENIKKSFELCSVILVRPEEHPLVQYEAVTCFQRLHLFGGKINLDIVIPVLYRSMKSTNLLLRRATIDSFRQLTQKDGQSAIVCQKVAEICQKEEDCPFVEYGLSGALFSMLDQESDEVLRKGIKDTLTSILSASIHDKIQLQNCISLCKSILTCDIGATEEEEAQGDFDDDVEEFKISNDDSNNSSLINNSRWSSRVFASECVRKILITSPHILHETGPELLRHLSDLIRMSFMGATSNSDSLRMEGLLNLETIIEKFANIKDPDFPKSSILEQFQAQVSAALRPAFSVETSTLLSATASRVCSAWICQGGSNQGGDDLRRVHTLMVTSLSNIRTKPTLPDYNESANTLEKLSILKAWAQVFISAVETGLQCEESLGIVIKGGGKFRNQLLEMVKPQLELLSPLWLHALRDRALIELPSEFAPQLPREGGSFFVNEIKDVVRPYYKDAWTPILLASAICVSTLADMLVKMDPDEEKAEAKVDMFHLVFGLSMEGLCKAPFSESMDSVEKYLKSLWSLFSSHWPRNIITQNKVLSIELCSVLHRQLVTRCDIKIQILVINVLKLVIEAMRENYNKISQEINEPITNGDANIEELTPGHSVVLSILEVIYCLLMQKIPILNSSVSGFHIKLTGTETENDILLGETVKCLELLLDICSDNAAIAIQPTILYLSTCVLGEANLEKSGNAVLHSFKKIATHRLNSDSQWEKYLLSTLAKILDMAKTGCDENNCFKTSATNRLQLLAAIGIFIKDGPAHLIKIPNLLYPSLNLYQQALQSDNDSFRIKSVGLICEIFEKAERSVATPFIHTVAPKILQYLYGEEARNVQTKSQLEFTLECIRSIQILVQIIETSEKRVMMLQLIVPVLINFLIDPAILSSVSSHRKLLHEFSLQRLMKIGPQYPLEFRSLMSQSNEMRLRLELAIKNSKLAREESQDKLNNSVNQSAPLQGTIKLKTNFSNFNS